MKYVESITVCPSNKTIRIGTWYHGATATVCPYDADKPSVCWYSDNESVATVNHATGYIYGMSLGTTRIYARACDGSGAEGYMTVSVNSTVPVESVRFNYSKLSIAKGHSASLAAIVCPENATNPSLNWSSNNEGVATVTNGTICGISEGTAIITATAKDGSGKSASCTVTVTNGILVSSITVNPSEKTMTVDGSAFLRATVYPSNATKKSVCWRSDNPNVVTVNENSGLIVAQNPGTTTLYAIACDGGGAQGYCRVTVQEPIKVECVCVYPQKLTIAPDEEEFIIASISPIWATNTSVTWKSSNPNVATVEKRTPANGNGNLAAAIGRSKGTATITATAKDGSNKKSSCTVTVDPREKVIVQKEGDYFKVIFADELVWKSIGHDMSLPENRTENVDIWDPEQRYLLNLAEQRFLDNYENFYSEKQFALLYLLDPFGVEYYLSQYNPQKYAEQFPENFENYDDHLRAYLKFKDRIYKEIFGRSPTPFVLSNDGRRVDVTWSYDRIDVFTDSELIFGAHNIVDMMDLLERAVDLVIELVDSILPDTTKNKWIMRGVNVAKTLLFSGSIVEAFSDAASDFLDDYIEDSSNGEIKIMEWPNPLLDNIYNFKKGIDEILTLPNIHDIKICDKVNKQSNYNVEFTNGSSKMFVEEIIELCS